MPPLTGKCRGRSSSRPCGFLFFGGRSRRGAYNPFADWRATRRSPLQNAEIARALETIVTLMELKDEAYYRVLAYQRAAESVAALGRPAREIENLKELPHVGATTAEVIRDLAENRTPQILADLLEEIPAGLVEVTRLPGVGPRTAGRLWRAVGGTSGGGVGAPKKGAPA